MLRLFTTLCLVATLGLFTSTLGAEEKDKKDKDNKQVRAKITKINPDEGTVTLKMKDKEGKEAERTFKLTKALRYLDSTGKVAAVDIFSSGDYVLVVEAEGKLNEMRRDKNQTAEKKD